MRQSTIFFVVAALVLIWFGAEAFPGQQICVTSCYSLVGMNTAEQVLAVVILPVLIALAGVSMRRTENQKKLEPAQRPPPVSSSSEDAQGGVAKSDPSPDDGKTMPP